MGGDRGLAGWGLMVYRWRIAVLMGVGWVWGLRGMPRGGGGWSVLGWRRVIETVDGR